MKKIIYVLICGILLCSAACRKYVEIPPLNLRVLEKTSDYEALLNYSVLFDASYVLPIYSSDDIGTDTITWQNTVANQTLSAYTWADRLYEPSLEDTEWNQMYKQIFNCNTIIDGVMGSSGGTEQEKEKILDEALVQRAYNYYTLVNMYAKQYDPASASTDLGLPLVLKPNFTGDLTRVSVQKIYDQIKADLNQALPGLPDLPDFNAHPSKVAVYAIMARVYLNTREFPESERNANLALGLQNTLIDLNAYAVNRNGFPKTRIQNPEQILYKKVTIGSYLPISDSGIGLFDVHDLRYQIFTTTDKDTTHVNFNAPALVWRLRTSDGVPTGPNVPEMMLIKAECEARAGNTDAAVSVLNDLRKKRFAPADYADLTAESPNEALHLVIDERGREFIGRGYRWFDQRRLNLDSGFVTTVTRVFKGTTYTLEPGSNRYMYAIADRLITLSPEIKQNPR